MGLFRLQLFVLPFLCCFLTTANSYLRLGKRLMYGRHERKQMIDTESIKFLSRHQVLEEEDEISNLRQSLNLGTLVICLLGYEKKYIRSLKPEKCIPSTKAAVGER